MLEKILIISLVIITLNPLNNLCIRAALNLNDQNAKGLKTIGASLITSDSETWQPIIKTKKWLAPPPTSFPSTSSTPFMSKASTPSMKSSSSRNTTLHKRQQHKQYLQPFHLTTDYIPSYNHRSENNSKFNLTTSQLSAAVASASSKIKFEPSHLLMLNTQKQLRHNLPHHHYLTKRKDNVYPKIPKDIIAQVKQPYMNTVAATFPHHFHQHNVADVNRHVHQSTQQHYANIITTPSLDNNLNVHPNAAGSILTKDLNSFETKSNLIDSNFTNLSANNSRRPHFGDVANAVVNVNEKLMLLQKTFDYVVEFYDNVKDIILSDKDNAYDSYSNEADIDASVSGSDATEAATEKLTSLKMKTTMPLLSSTLLGEVQGHKRQTDKGTTMKHSLTSQQNEIENVPATATRSLMWNNSKANSALTSSSTRLTPTSALSTFSTGRKIKKKFKKKFQKFLFPLVLAYKLKFLALIPLLIGGLTLLVGTTGLAGFFFALFTAVMSLKSGAKSAIVVKKY